MGSGYARHVVGDAEALELALFVELVDRLHRHLVRDAAIRPVEVPHVDRAVSPVNSISVRGRQQRPLQRTRSAMP